MIPKPAFSLILILLLASNLLIAQEAGSVSCSEPLVQQAMLQLDAALSPPEGELFKFASDNKLKGTYVFDISIRKKGEVSTVFVVSAINAEVPMQNLLKDRIKAFRFNLKIPRDTTYKFRYTFRFDP